MGKGLEAELDALRKLWSWDYEALLSGYNDMIWLGNRGIDITDQDAVLAFVSQLETGVVKKGGDREISWRGVMVSFVPTSKKKGGNCKRGDTWGCIKYFDESRYLNGNGWSHPEISKEKAIAEIMKPDSLKRATTDLMNMAICLLCGHIALGKAMQVQWGELNYPKTFMRMGMGSIYVNSREHKDICPDCIKELLTKHKG
jgi:hypothetical protein